jgi:hypothetical protein
LIKLAAGLENVSFKMSLGMPSSKDRFKMLADTIGIKILDKVTNVKNVLQPRLGNIDNSNIHMKDIETNLAIRDAT